MKSGCRHCVAWAAEDEHPDPRGGLEVARVEALRCQRVKDNHRPRPPTHPRDVHIEQLYSPVPLQGVTVVPPCPMTPPPHRKWPQQSMFPPPHARSSHSSEGTALASLDQDKVLEDDFQTQHTSVHHVKWRGDSGGRASARGGPECYGGSLGQWAVYCLDIGKEEETLETVDPTWQTTCWLQLAVQSISDDEVPWYECMAPLTSGAEGTALLLAKHFLAIWRWSLRVQGQDVCPTVLNIGQFMTRDEVRGEVDNTLWFEVYSRALQRVGEAIHGWRWQWPKGKAREVAVSPIVRAFWEETGMEPAASCTRLLLGAPAESSVQEKGEGHCLTSDHLPR